MQRNVAMSSSIRNSMHGASARTFPSFLITRHTALSIGWLRSTKSSQLYRKLPAKTCKSYDAALRHASQHKLKDGRNFGVLPLKSITPGAADRLFDRLKERPAGGERVRTAVLVVTICKRGMSRGEVIE